MLLILSLLSFTLTAGHANGLRCELVSDSCLDLTRVTNPTITVPSNTTRIDKNGIGICLPYLMSYRAVDIIFIIDQSTSMETSDPEKLVSPASIAALNLIDSLAPESNVGFMGFSVGVCDGTQKHVSGAGKKYRENKSTLIFPKSLNSPGHKDTLLEPMTFSPDNFLVDCGHIATGGTNYYRPFLLAEKWMKQMDSPNEQIIIFLTDGGNNTERDLYTKMLKTVDSTNFPIVHAIFVNSGRNDELELMTEKTKGLYTQIEDFTSIKEVMKEMVGASIIPSSPENTTIAKNGQLAVQTTDHSHISSTQFQVNMLYDLSLETGQNEFTITTKSREIGNKKNGIQIKVSGPAETSPGKKDVSGSNLFDLACHEASTIVTTEKSSFNPINKLAVYRETGFGISLNTPADDITAVVSVQGAGDAEDIALPDTTTSGYRGIAAFSHGTLKTPNNGIVEGFQGDVLRLIWTHPYDPRDTASALLPLFDSREDTTEIIFKDMQGSPITSIDDLSGTQFKLVVLNNKAVGSFSVKLTSSHGDTLIVTVRPTGPKTFMSVVPFGFPLAVNRANTSIEGVFDSTSSRNQTTVIASVKKVVNSLVLKKIYTPLKNVWIIDENEDGRADKIFIRFTEALKNLPAYITDIHWPGGHSTAKRAPASNELPDLNPLSFVNDTTSLVQIDFSQDPFEFGATEASIASPPTLTLPDGRKPEIQDSIKPMVLFAEKKPSDFHHYKPANDSAFKSYPDSLIITLSEAITPIPIHANPWKNLFLVEKINTFLFVDMLSEPVIISNNGRTLLVIIDNNTDSTTVKVGDKLSMNPGAFYLDGNGNKLSHLPVQVVGRDGSKAGFVSAWRGGAISGDQKAQTIFINGPQIPEIDVMDGTVLKYVPEARVDKWITPVGFDITTGDVDIKSQLGPTCREGNDFTNDFPLECLASRVILTGTSEGPYVATINIYDHLGKFIRNLKQAFGYCGELQDRTRYTESKFIMNDLVWNMKDGNGKTVGSGVYIWRISLKFANGYTKERAFKMGFLRADHKCQQFY